MDILASKERSKRMSLIRSKWTKQEIKVHHALKGRKVQHKMHPLLQGNPDILIGKNKVVFLHGCFWHKCPDCYREPMSRKEYWVPKIEKNVLRDLRNRKFLERKGYRVIVIWEHELRKNFESFMEKLIK